MSSLNKTPLFDYHFEVGAKMIPVGSWTMPFQFGDGCRAEYLHGLEGCCIVDFCCANIYRMTGGNFTEFSRIAPELAVGQGDFCEWRADGKIIDVPFAVRMAEDDFLTAFSPSARNICLKSFDNDELQDLSELFGCIAVWGRESAEILETLGADVAEWCYGTADKIEIAGVRCICCKINVFADIPGFMLFCDREKVDDVWIALFNTEGVWASGIGSWDMGRMLDGKVPYNALNLPHPLGLFKWQGRNLPRRGDMVQWDGGNGVLQSQVIYSATVPQADDSFLLVSGEFAPGQPLKRASDEDEYGVLTEFFS